MLVNETHHICLESNNDEITIKKFGEIHQYIVLEKIKNSLKSGFAVINHLYVNPSYEEDFERIFLNRNRNLKNIEGFEGLLFLKPKTIHTHYVIITIWEDATAYKNWQDSAEYKDSHRKRGTKNGADQDIINRGLSFNISIDLYNKY